MPLVKVEILKERSNNYKKAIFDSIHSALTEASKIPDNDRTIIARFADLYKACRQRPS